MITLLMILEKKYADTYFNANHNANIGHTLIRCLKLQRFIKKEEFQ